MTDQNKQTPTSFRLSCIHKIKMLEEIKNDYTMSNELRNAAEKQIEELFKKLGMITYDKFESLKGEEWQNETD